MLSPNSFPSPTSVRVTNAPGGYSSLSLAWNSNEIPKVSKNPEPPKGLARRGQPITHNPSSDFQSYIPPNLSLSESNRLLEEELYYYQQKNKLLRESIFGPADNLDRIQSKLDQSRLSSRPPLYNYEGQRRGEESQREELQRALEDRERYRLQQRNAIGYEMRSPQRLSVKVSSPPGGRSSIFFG